MFIGCLLIATIVGGYFTIRLSLPVLIWQLDGVRVSTTVRPASRPATAGTADSSEPGDVDRRRQSVFAITNLAVSQKNAFIGAVAT